YYDEVVVVDDHSGDETAELARRLNLKAIRHPHNVGYGGNQRTCYMEALRDGADIIVMLHPDGQYDPAIIPEMIRPIREGRADMVLGSRMMLPGGAARGGMPLWKRIANRFLTTAENLAMGRRFSECHPGYRASSRRLLEPVPFLRGPPSSPASSSSFWRWTCFARTQDRPSLPRSGRRAPPRSSRCGPSWASVTCGRASVCRGWRWPRCSSPRTSATPGSSTSA